MSCSTPQKVTGRRMLLASFPAFTLMTFNFNRAPWISIFESESDILPLITAFWIFFSLTDSLGFVWQHELKWLVFPQELHILPMAAQISYDASYLHLGHFRWHFVWIDLDLFMSFGFSVFLKEYILNLVDLLPRAPLYAARTNSGDSSLISNLISSGCALISCFIDAYFMNVLRSWNVFRSNVPFYLINLYIRLPICFYWPGLVG